MAEAAAKESSMEDILSSIRKIISEDENGIKPARSEEIAEPVEALKPTMEQNTPAHTGGEQAAVSMPEGKALSLAEIAANVKAGVVTPQPAQAEPVAPAAPVVQAAEPAPQVDQPAAAPVADESSGLKLSEIVAKMSAFKEDTEVKDDPAPSPAPVVESAAPAPVVEGPAPVEAAPQVEIKEAPAQPEAKPSAEVAVSVMPEASNEADSFKTALMSPSSNAAVTDSLERLKRSAMDDMDAKTESILRPMLREWLDENLPTMVERLVREEIERVSRGV